MGENNNEQPGKRQLKIYPKYFSRTYDSIIFPEIRLCGKWLQDSGFKCGEAVHVKYEKNKIVITVDETE